MDDVYDKVFHLLLYMGLALFFILIASFFLFITLSIWEVAYRYMVEESYLYKDFISSEQPCSSMERASVF